MLYGINIEICAGSRRDIEIADRYSEVDRIEVNSHLEEDGLSCEQQEFNAIRSLSPKSLLCMVRPRGGNFLYSEEEKAEMLKEAEYFCMHGADGIVFGCLDEHNQIDLPFTKKMLEITARYHKEAIFHKAFDVTPDPYTAAKQLADLHVQRILTSGGKSSAMAGLQEIALLEEQLGDRIQILPGGGISASNIAILLKKTRCTRFHMSLRSDNPEQKLLDVLEAIRSMHFNHAHVLTGEDAEMMEEDAYEQSMETQEDTHDQ